MSDFIGSLQGVRSEALGGQAVDFNLVLNKVSFFLPDAGHLIFFAAILNPDA
jgi:hypothetical protein